MNLRSELVTAYQLQAIRFKERTWSERWLVYFRSWIYGMLLVSVFVGALLWGFRTPSSSASSPPHAENKLLHAPGPGAALGNGAFASSVNLPTAAIQAAPAAASQPRAPALALTITAPRAFLERAPQASLRATSLHSASAAVPLAKGPLPPAAPLLATAASSNSLASDTQLKRAVQSIPEVSAAEVPNWRFVPDVAGRAAPSSSAPRSKE